MSILIQEVMSGSYIVKDDLGGHIIGYCASPPPPIPSSLPLVYFRTKDTILHIHAEA